MTSKVGTENVTVKIIMDALILVLLLSYYAISVHYFTPFHRGYFCDDENIMYPDKQDTIPLACLVSMAILIPLILIIFTVAVGNNERTKYSEMSEKVFCGWKIPQKLQHIYESEVVFLFGFCITIISVHFIKLLSGRLRPNFLGLCQSDFNCSSVGNPHFFVEDYTCTNPDYSPNDKQLRFSFPSGHGAVSTYSMLLASLYLQKHFRSTQSSLLKPVIQFLLLLLATYISLTRIRDNKHHADDVIAGVVLGLIICLIMVFVLSDDYKTGTRISLPEEKKPLLGL